MIFSLHINERLITLPKSYLINQPLRKTEETASGESEDGAGHNNKNDL